MRSRYKVIEGGAYFVTSTIVGWVKIFKSKRFANIIIDELNFRRNRKELQLHGFVIMPNHIHLMISSENIPKVMRSIKSYTAMRIIEELEYCALNGITKPGPSKAGFQLRYDEEEQKLFSKEDSKVILNKFRKLKLNSKTESEYQIWQEGYHPKQILSEHEYEQKMNYIHFNPVKKELVESPELWKYSSYNNYYGGDTVLEIDKF